MMKGIFNAKTIATLSAIVLMAGVGDSLAQRRKPVAKKRLVPVYRVDTGTIIRVRMNNTISSKTAHIGQTFTTNVTEPVYSTNGVVVIPVGSTVVGRVDMVSPAAKKGTPGKIDAHFTSVR